MEKNSNYYLIKLKGKKMKNIIIYQSKIKFNCLLIILGIILTPFLVFCAPTTNTLTRNPATADFYSSAPMAVGQHAPNGREGAAHRSRGKCETEKARHDLNSWLEKMLALRKGEVPLAVYP